MARRLIIGEILNLIKDIGGNPSKFMGTKTNINFLGKGPKQALFQGQLDINSLGNLSKEIVIGEAETAGGYAAANKLNDFQLQRLKDNLLQVKKIYNPPANITDMASGTGDLTQEGLGSLREGVKRFPKESHEFFGRPLKDADFVKIDQLVAEGKIPAAEGTPPLMTRIEERMNKIKGMADDLGKGDVKPTFEFIDPAADKVSYASRFNPRNEVHVNKAEALLKDPQLKGVYTEAEVKNAYDFEGLYQSHFDKGQVDIARLLEQEGHNIPQMRSAARDALLQLTKVDDAVPFAEIDIKYITEGGGGREGDPINLMVKYFGKNVTENLPKDATKESIGKFTEFLTRAKDSQGRGINDPFFDRETIEFTEFASGGRAGFRLGGFGGKFTKAQVLIARLKNTIKGSKDKYVQETFPNFIKEIEANPKLAENENVWKALGGDLPKDQRLVVHGDDTVDFFTQTKFGPHNIENITKFLEQHPFLTREEAMRILKMEPEDRILEITRLETIRRTPNASGGLAKILEV